MQADFLSGVGDLGTEDRHLMPFLLLSPGTYTAPLQGSWGVPSEEGEAASQNYFQAVLYHLWGSQQLGEVPVN